MLRIKHTYETAYQKNIVPLQPFKSLYISNMTKKYRSEANNYKKRVTTLLFLTICSLYLMATDLEFHSLNISDGLAGSRVNCILKDRSGFLWFGTDAGLSRFDGFRFHNFYCSTSDENSLISNQVSELQMDGKGYIWVQTPAGYNIYNPLTEQFSREIPDWMAKCGIKKFPDVIYIDHQQNFWMAVKEVGCYYYNVKTDKSILFKFGKKKGEIPYGEINSFTERGKSLVVSYNNGMLMRLDAQQHRIVWINRNLPQETTNFQYYRTFIDSQYNYWVSNGSNHTYIYHSASHRWFNGAQSFFAFLGMKAPAHNFLIRDMKEDGMGRLWIATEHDGLYIVEPKKKTFEHILADNSTPNSIPDNTLEHIFLDDHGAVWLGTYKNGVAYYSPTLSLYPTLPLGDICTMVQDRMGNYWLGTNDKSIVCYNPATGTHLLYNKEQTHLGSNVIVSSLRGRDGSLWFGSFNGGITHYINGSFNSYHTQNSKLANNSVWSMVEDRQGHIILGTLGSGIQIFTPTTNKFVNVNMGNSALPSDYIASLSIDPKGKIVIGHSKGISFLDPKTLKVTNFKNAKNGDTFSSPMVTQVLVDSRGLLWCSTMSGLDTYDPKTDKMYHIYKTPVMACALVEDKNGNVWATLARNMVRIKVGGTQEERSFFLTNYDDLDGLQKRNFNFRSIMLDDKGSIVAGGQDGINILPMNKISKMHEHSKAVFSGVVLFDHILKVGETFHDRIVLEEAVNESKKLVLNYSENAFSILLATNHVVVPEKSSFMYRLVGFNDDKWLMTMESQPSVTYTNLSPGKYRLQVKVVNRDGSVSQEMSEMEIIIRPPFWLSWWAILFYLLLFAGILWLIWYFYFYRKMEQLKVQQQLSEAEHKHQLDEAKLTFYADVSHDLRTPLALVISPVKVLLDKESDPAKAKSLELIYRNAKKLLDLVNKTLDLHMIESLKNLVGSKNATSVVDKMAEEEPKENLTKLLAQMNDQLKKGEYEVLVVDDSEDFLTFMTEALSDTYKVVTANNGKDALRKIAQHKPDIILSDVMMPEMDGNDLCRAIRSNPKTERIPFVMLTARLSTEARIEGMTSGADDYITKPFNFDLLNLRIYNLIKWRHTTPIGEKLEPEIKQVEITSVDEQLVKDATNFVEDNLDNTNLSVEMMSSHLGMSRVNLYKRILSVTGSTPSEFIRTIRLRHGEQLLREGKYNVSEVAYMVGFNSPRYFSKYFAEAYGKYPSQYKNDQTKEDEEDASKS